MSYSSQRRAIINFRGVLDLIHIRASLFYLFLELLRFLLLFYQNEFSMKFLAGALLIGTVTGRLENAQLEYSRGP